MQRPRLTSARQGALAAETPWQVSFVEWGMERWRKSRGVFSGWLAPGLHKPAEPVAQLLELVPRKAPPRGLLFRIEARIDEIEREDLTSRTRSRTRRELVGAALGGALAAASVAVFLRADLPDPAARDLVLADASQVPVLSARTGSGILRLGAPAARPDGALELWLIQGGVGAPQSLGLVAAKGEVTLLPLAKPLLPGDVLALSEEAYGGSPGPGPTGRVIATVTVPRG